MTHVTLNILSLLFASVAFAGPGKYQSLSFEDLKIACQNPAKFHNQTAPQNIQVACRDVQQKWVPDSDGAFSLSTARQISVAVQSDKYTVEARDVALQSSAQLMNCAQYKQVTETLETVRSVSCEEIVAFSGSGSDFCVESLNSLRLDNPQASLSDVTGRTYSLCGQANAYEGPGQRPNQRPLKN